MSSLIQRPFALVSLALILLPGAGWGEPVRINEFMAVNSGTFLDEDGETSDWIELHNGATGSVDLTGWYLSDDADELTKWSVPSTNISPHGFLIVFASGKDRVGTNGALHASFKLSGDGEYLALVDPLTNVVSAFSPRYPVQHSDVSYGFPVGGDPGVATYLNPTPGTSNIAGTVFLAPAPDFSVPAGFYTNGFSLALSSTTQSVVIRYSLNGAEPTTNSPAYTIPLAIGSRTGESNVYSEIRTTRDPFGWLPDWVPPAGEVFKGTVVRARLFRDDEPVSPIATATYFIDPNAARLYGTLPVISVVSDPAHLFDDETGIYVPGNTHIAGNSWTGNYAQDWERPAHVQLFETNRTVGFAQDIGIRIQGSTSIASPQKGLHVIARSQYGDNRIRYPVFHNTASSANRLTEFKRFALRGWSSCLKYSLINDAYTHTIMSDANIDIQDYRPAVMFLNGEYWGLFEMREANKNPWYYQYHYGIDAEDPGYDIWEVQQGTWYVDEGTADHWNVLVDYINANDLSQPAPYAYVCTRIDMPGFIAYVGHCIYSGKADWPGQNEARVRPRTPDGKWRWPQFDADHSFNGLNSTYSQPGYNSLERAISGNRQHWLLIALLANTDFKRDFINWFADNMNSRLLPEVLRAHHARMFGELLPYISEYRHRWPLAGNANWDTRTAPILDFADQRPGYMRQFLMDEFGLVGTVNVTLDVVPPESGTVRIGTIEINEDTKGVATNVYPWQGTYFAWVPLTFTALPRSGYRFLKWEGDTRIPLNPLTLTPATGISLAARFELDPFYPDGVVVTEIMTAPYPPVTGTNVASDYEYIELCNLGTNRADLGGVRFVDGIDFAFLPMSLETGDYVVVVANRAAFASRHDTNGITIAGEFSGGLSDAGERIALADGKGSLLWEFSYDEGRGWPVTAAGAGHALVPLSPANRDGLDYGGNWRAGSYLRGSPGRRDPEMPEGVRLNELAAHTDYSGGEPWQDSNDWIELFNTGTGTVDFANWYLSDSISDLEKWALPPGTVVAPGQWVRFTEVDHFHTATNVGFGLDKAGEQVFLSYLPGTADDRVVDAVRFEGQERDRSLGRSPDGGVWWYELPRTPAAANAVPTNTVVVSEIMYNPAAVLDGALYEYVEIQNLATTGVFLWVEEVLLGTNWHLPWRLAGGVDYMFPTGVTLNAGERLLLVPFSPSDSQAVASFRYAYGIEGVPVRMFGPYGGRLSDGGDRVSLEKALLPDRPGDRLGWAIVDEVIYHDRDPWPRAADGSGRPLVRGRVHRHGCDPASWYAGLMASPGRATPEVALVTPMHHAECFADDGLQLVASVSDDLLFGGSPEVRFFVEGEEIGIDATPPYTSVWAVAASPGDYALHVEAWDGGSAYTSFPVTVTVLEPPVLDLSQGASLVSDDSATLNALLVRGDPADITFFWGEADAGTNAGAWERTASLGTRSGGACTATVHGLMPRRGYVYRARADRAGRSFWSAHAVPFRSSSLQDWPYAMQVSLPGYDASAWLTNFPAHVVLSSAIDGFSYTQCASPSGHDLRFTDEQGDRLDHELVEWDTTGVSRAWVRVPLLTATTSIRAHWGYADAVGQPSFTTNGSAWDNTFRGVWHFDAAGSPPGAFADSAGGGFNGAPIGTTAATGQVGQARAFAGSDTITVSAGVAAPLDQQVTVSLWVKGGSEQPVNDQVFWATEGGQRVFGSHLPWGDGNVYWDAGADGGTYDRIHKACSPDDYRGRWTFWTFTKDATAGEMKIYMDGSLWHSGSGSRDMTGINAMSIGSSTAGTSGYRGAIDEFRLSGVARSSEWIAASYATMVAPGAFAAFGPVEDDAYDGDGDGMPDRWERLHFSGTNALAGGGASDPDGDGRLNWEELVAGTDPTNAGSVFALTLSLAGGHVAVIMDTTPTDTPGVRGRQRFYSLQTAATVTGTWHSVPGYLDLPGGGATIRFTPDPPETERYFRGQVRME